MPVERVDDMVDFWSILRGVDGTGGPGGVGTTPKTRWYPMICMRVWWEVVRDILILRVMNGFMRRTYPTQRFCSSRWKLPFRVRRMESCNRMCPNQVNYVHMDYPNQTK